MTIQSTEKKQYTIKLFGTNLPKDGKLLQNSLFLLGVDCTITTRTFKKMVKEEYQKSPPKIERGKNG